MAENNFTYLDEDGFFTQSDSDFVNEVLTDGCVKLSEPNKLALQIAHSIS